MRFLARILKPEVLLMLLDLLRISLSCFWVVFSVLLQFLFFGPSACHFFSWAGGADFRVASSLLCVDDSSSVFCLFVFIFLRFLLWEKLFFVCF